VPSAGSRGRGVVYGRATGSRPTADRTVHVVGLTCAACPRCPAMTLATSRVTFDLAARCGALAAAAPCSRRRRPCRFGGQWPTMSGCGGRCRWRRKAELMRSADPGCGGARRSAQWAEQELQPALCGPGTGPRKPSSRRAGGKLRRISSDRCGIPGREVSHWLEGRSRCGAAPTACG
jgi:hypothetical protein